MAKTLHSIIELVANQEVRISNHGYDELAADSIFVREILSGVKAAQSVEDYPDYPKGPRVLVLQRDQEGKPIHVVWEIPRNASGPAVLVTAYRPTLDRWTPDFMRRKP